MPLAHYRPGFKAGGPIQSIENLVTNLSDDFDFRIITRNHDLGDPTPFDGVTVDEWHQLPGCQVLYVSGGARAVLHHIKRTKFDILYLNSFFDPAFTIMPLVARHLGLIAKKPVILAPRGEFSPGALTLKSWKKSPFLLFARLFGLYRPVLWHSTSNEEKAYIVRATGIHQDAVRQAGNIPKMITRRQGDAVNDRPALPLRIVFVARISRIKNLLGALSVLKRVQSAVTFDIFGPKEDADYWRRCEDMLPSLPSNVTCRYQGAISSAEVISTIEKYDLFFLPTQGENFGHSIAESFAAGVPALVSDRTPWRNLEQDGIGADIALEDEKAFARYIDRKAGESREERRATKQKVQAYAEKIARQASQVLEDYRTLFQESLRR